MYLDWFGFENQSEIQFDPTQKDIHINQIIFGFIVFLIF